jgi:adenylate kinase
VNIILVGPPGAGKGTQSDKLAKDFKLRKLSTGDILREEINKKTSLGNEIKIAIDKGNFVSDEIINNLIHKVLVEKSSFDKLIFDGYPRNLDQAISLDKLLIIYKQKISCVLNLNVNKEILIKRISGRQVCSNCGLIFNKFFNPSNKENHKCESKFLEIRSDDTDKTLIHRLDTYFKETIPVVNYYKKQNLIKEVEGNAKIDQIYKEIRHIIDSLDT